MMALSSKVGAPIRAYIHDKRVWRCARDSGWDHRKTCHISKERYARCLKWPKESGIFSDSWLLDKNVFKVAKI